MATPNEKLAESLAKLKVLQEGGRRVFRSNELSRVHRERLVANGFMQEVIKGWLISAGPSARAGDSTPWYASFWEFCARYCNERFGDQWHLSAEQSLCLHGEKTVIPDQVVVNSPKGSNNSISLPFGTSIYDLKVPAMPTGKRSCDTGRIAALLASGVSRQSNGILHRQKSGGDASGVDPSRRCLRSAAAAAERRALCESRLPGRSIPADRAIRNGGRDHRLR